MLYMSYDVGFTVDGERVTFDEPHQLAGGTYAVGGTTEAWLNITYNYGAAFYTLFGDNGLRTLYNLSAAEVRKRVAAALEQKDTFPMEESPCTCNTPWLGRRPFAYHDPERCYWATTRSNVVSALENLLKLAELSPDDAVFNGD